MKVTRIVFTPTGETRKPKKGEWYVHDGHPWRTRYDGSYVKAFSIYERTEEEVEIPDPDPVPEWATKAARDWCEVRSRRMLDEFAGEADILTIGQFTCALAKHFSEAYRAAKERGEA